MEKRASKTLALLLALAMLIPGAILMLVSADDDFAGITAKRVVSPWLDTEVAAGEVFTGNNWNADDGYPDAFSNIAPNGSRIWAYDSASAEAYDFNPATSGGTAAGTFSISGFAGPLGSQSATDGAKFSSTGMNEFGWSTSPTITQYYQTESKATLLNGGTGLLLYMEAPNKWASQGTMFFQFQFSEGTVGADSTYGGVISDTGTYYTLSSSDTAWQSGTAGWLGMMNLPDFKGYIYIPFTSLAEADGATPLNLTNNRYLKQISLQSRVVGNGMSNVIADGSFSFSTLSIVTNDPTSAAVTEKDKILFEGDENPFDIFTGAEILPPVSDPVSSDDSSTTSSGEDEEPVTGVATADTFTFLDDQTVGQVVTGGMATYFAANGGLLAADPDLRVAANPTGLLSSNILQVGTNFSKTISQNTPGDHDKMHTKISMGLRELTGDTGLMFYVKMPKSPEGENGQSALIVTLSTRSPGASSDNLWPVLLSGAPYYTIASDDEDWTKRTVDTADVGIGWFTFPSEFEGWVRVPFSSWAPNPTGLTFQSFDLRFKDFGGSLGTGSIGNFLFATNNIISKRGIVLDGQNIIKDIFTGATLTYDEVKPDPTVPVPGEVVLELPQPTTDKYPTESDITQTSVKLTWDATAGAAGYRVEVYRSQAGDGGVEFVLVKYLDTTGTGAVIDGLSPDTRYSFVAKALDAEGYEIAVYDSVAVNTLAGENPDSSYNYDEDDWGNDSDGGYWANTDTGDTVLITVFLVIAAISAAVLIVIRKKSSGDSV